MSDRTTWRLESQNEQLRDEVARLRLTDEERQAISAAACICEDAGRTDIAVIINTALERLG
jgi:hypothetical protein